MCYTKRNIKYFLLLQLSFSGLLEWQVVSAEESSSFNPSHKALRQNFGKGETVNLIANVGPPTESAVGAANRFHKKDGKTKTRRFVMRSTPMFISQRHYCDHLARPCIHAFVTGKICAKTVLFKYETFDTYCMMEYINCRENYEVWTISHTGACFNVKKVTDYMQYAYHDDFFLDNYYIVDDKLNHY